jgi:hypothetical protein
MLAAQQSFSNPEMTPQSVLVRESIEGSLQYAILNALPTGASIARE